MARLIKADKMKFQDPGHYDKHDRKEIPKDDFGEPETRKFPIVTQQDVYDAAHLIGHAKDPDKVKKRIEEIAKRKGFKLPDDWKEQEEKKDNDKKASRSSNRIIARILEASDDDEGTDNKEDQDDFDKITSDIDESLKHLDGSVKELEAHADCGHHDARDLDGIVERAKETAYRLEEAKDKFADDKKEASRRSRFNRTAEDYDNFAGREQEVTDAFDELHRVLDHCIDLSREVPDLNSATEKLQQMKDELQDLIK